MRTRARFLLLLALVATLGGCRSSVPVRIERIDVRGEGAAPPAGQAPNAAPARRAPGGPVAGEAAAPSDPAKATAR